MHLSEQLEKIKSAWVYSERSGFTLFYSMHTISITIQCLHFLHSSIHNPYNIYKIISLEAHRESKDEEKSYNACHIFFGLLFAPAARPTSNHMHLER